MTDYILLEGDLKEIDEWTLRSEAWTDQHNSMFDLRWDHYDSNYCFMCGNDVFESLAGHRRFVREVFNAPIYVGGKQI